jgi:hypothetical protein
MLVALGVSVLLLSGHKVRRFNANNANTEVIGACGKFCRYPDSCTMVAEVGFPT